MMSMDIDIAPQRLGKVKQQTDLNKMDILFYDSILSIKQSYLFSIVYHFMKGAIFIVFIPIDYTVIGGPNDSKIMAAMIIALVVSLLQSLSQLLFRCTSLRDNILLLSLSAEMGHSSPQQKVKQAETSQLQRCVSTTLYNKQNQTLISNQGLTKQIKKMYTKFLSANIKEKLKSHEEGLTRIDSFTGFLGLLSMVYAIVALATGKVNTPQLVLLIIYIILEGFSKIIIILIFVALALSPILCCLILFCACCCINGQNQPQLPAPEKATQQMITQAGGTCSICFQNFIVDDNIIRLRCSPKHMFHPMCIEGWAKLKATCPICRAPMGQQLNQSAPI